MNIKKNLFIAGILFFIVITGIIFLISEYTKNEENDKKLWDTNFESIIPNPAEDVSDKEQENISLNTVKTKTIYVHICGKVKKPGVYETYEGERVIDIVKLAGGFTKDASQDYVNLAEYICDGQKIYIPSEKDILEEKSVFSDMEESQKKGKININKASKEELMTITGIGESRAESIIAYREENGSFKSKEEIKNIDGIKDGLYNKIQDFIIIN